MARKPHETRKGRRPNRVLADGIRSFLFVAAARLPALWRRNSAASFGSHLGRLNESIPIPWAPLGREVSSKSLAAGLNTIQKGFRKETI